MRAQIHGGNFIPQGNLSNPASRIDEIDAGKYSHLLRTDRPGLDPSVIALRNQKTRELLSGPQFHGTNGEFPNGFVMTPPADRGVESTHGHASFIHGDNDPGAGRENYTFQTSDPDAAAKYAQTAQHARGGGRNVYEVASDNREPDPEAPTSQTRSRGSMRIVRKLDPSEYHDPGPYDPNNAIDLDFI